MKQKRQDFKVVPCERHNRDTTDLWDIKIGGQGVATVRGREQADMICEYLNQDPWYLERGQDRMSRGGCKNHER